MRLARCPGLRKTLDVSRALIVIALAATLAGCSWLPDYANPVAWYGDLTGASKSDATSNAQPNVESLEAGGHEPYPNIGTVPPVPENAMSTVDREKLQKGLVADRSHAEYSDQQLHAGQNVPALPGGEPQVAMAATASIGAPAASSAGGASASTVTASSGTPATPAPGAASASTATASSATPATPAPGVSPAAASPGTGTAAAPATGSAAPARTPQQKVVKGSVPPPQESPLVSPSIANLPQGETPHAPPPAPTGEQPAQVAVVVPTPPIPPPAIAAPITPTTEPPIMRGPSGRRGVTLEAASIVFGGAGTALSDEDNRHLAEVAKERQQHGGSLRVIGYGGNGPGTTAQQQRVAGFNAALDRANRVAQALVKLGVPMSRMTVQAEPPLAGGGRATGQVVVVLEY
jgi:outer membrane protein OmpA-like peptidoglycan-associated protein